MANSFQQGDPYAALRLDVLVSYCDDDDALAPDCELALDTSGLLDVDEVVAIEQFDTPPAFSEATPPRPTIAAGGDRFRKSGGGSAVCSPIQALACSAKWGCGNQRASSASIDDDGDVGGGLFDIEKAPGRQKLRGV